MDKYNDKFPLKEMPSAYVSQESPVHEAFGALEPRKDILGVTVRRFFGDGRMYALPPSDPIPGEIPRRPDPSDLNLTDAKSKPVASVPATPAPFTTMPLDKKSKPLTPTELLVKTMKIPEYEAKQINEKFESILKGLLEIYLKHWSNIPMGETC
jgi:hypothetical protein